MLLGSPYVVPRGGLRVKRVVRRWCGMARILRETRDTSSASGYVFSWLGAAPSSDSMAGRIDGRCASVHAAAGAAADIAWDADCGGDSGLCLTSSYLPWGGGACCFGISTSWYSPSVAHPLLNTSSETRYGRMLSFLNSLTSGQGGAHLSRYIPSTDTLGLMAREIAVAMKYTLRQPSHMMPMWTGMMLF